LTSGSSSLVRPSKSIHSTKAVKLIILQELVPLPRTTSRNEVCPR
jgi:hypothetical protein